MKLTEEEFGILVMHRANTKESQAIRKRLLQAGLKYCGVCIALKPPLSFHRSSGNPDGRHNVCKSCDQRGKDRRRKGMSYFEFTQAERDQRYRDRLTPEQRAAYFDRGNAQRDPVKWREWYDARKLSDVAA